MEEPIKENSKCITFSESLRECHTNKKRDNDVHNWNKKQNNPPCWFFDNFQKNPNIVDWNNCSPAWLSGFLKYFPIRSNYENNKNKHEHHKQRVIKHAWLRILWICRVSSVVVHTYTMKRSGTVCQQTK